MDNYTEISAYTYENGEKTPIKVYKNGNGFIGGIERFIEDHKDWRLIKELHIPTCISIKWFDGNLDHLTIDKISFDEPEYKVGVANNDLRSLIIKNGEGIKLFMELNPNIEDLVLPKYLLHLRVDANIYYNLIKDKMDIDIKHLEIRY